ncbi:MAG: hypothetical protein ACOYMA_07465 [Bacteroidia bacterium]
MNIALLEVFYDEYEYVSYYTVRLEIDEQKEALSETDKFYKLYNDPNHLYYKEFGTILSAIDAMGFNKRGAERWILREEDAALALPPKRKPAEKVLLLEVIEHSKLRLYCIWLTNGVVILLNGGIKTRDSALDCPNVSGQFRFAQSIAKAIYSLMADGSIIIEDNEIINNTGEQDIVLYY